MTTFFCLTKNSSPTTTTAADSNQDNTNEAANTDLEEPASAATGPAADSWALQSSNADILTSSVGRIESMSAAADRHQGGGAGNGGDPELSGYTESVSVPPLQHSSGTLHTGKDLQRQFMGC